MWCLLAPSRSSSSSRRTLRRNRSRRCSDRCKACFSRSPTPVRRLFVIPSRCRPLWRINGCSSPLSVYVRPCPSLLHLRCVMWACVTSVSNLAHRSSSPSHHRRFVRIHRLVRCSVRQRALRSSPPCRTAALYVHHTVLHSYRRLQVGDHCVSLTPVEFRPVASSDCDTALSRIAAFERGADSGRCPPHHAPVSTALLWSSPFELLQL